VPADLSDDAALFGIARPLRSYDVKTCQLPDDVLGNATSFIAERTAQMDLDQVLVAQREYSVVLNTEAGADRFFGGYKGVDVPRIVRTFNDVGLDVCAFGSTALTLDGRIPVATDDFDVIGDIDRNWPLVVEAARRLNAQPTWSAHDPSVDANGIQKVTFRITDAGLLEMYNHDSVIKAYGHLAYGGRSFGEALEMRRTVAFAGTSIQTLTTEASLTCTGCVGREKDIPKGVYAESMLKASASQGRDQGLGVA